MITDIHNIRMYKNNSNKHCQIIILNTTKNVSHLRRYNTIIYMIDSDRRPVSNQGPFHKFRVRVKVRVRVPVKVRVKL
jgi:hypothetical protein